MNFNLLLRSTVSLPAVCITVPLELDSIGLALGRAAAQLGINLKRPAKA